MNKKNKSKTIFVIGAGIVGVSTAIWLIRKNYNVELIDKKGIAGGASFGNGGVLASSGIIPLSVPGLFFPLLSMYVRPNGPLFISWTYIIRNLFSVYLWLIDFFKNSKYSKLIAIAKNLTYLLGDSLQQHQQLSAGTEAEKWVIKSDYLFVYKNIKSLQKDSFAWKIREKLGFKHTIVKLDKYHSFYKDGIKAGYARKLSNHGYIKNPNAYLNDLVKYFIKQGGKYKTAELKDFVFAEENGESIVKSVIINDKIINCDSLVLCTGAYSKLLAKKLGLNVLMEGESGYHIDLINPSNYPKSPCIMVAEKVVITPMQNKIRIAGLVEFAGLKSKLNKKAISQLKTIIQSLMPNIKYESLEIWHGHRPTTSDSLPVIGRSGKYRNILYAFGHQHVGLTGGPKTGIIISELIDGIDKNKSEISRFSPRRFE